MSKKKNQDKSKKDPLQNKLAKFKNKSIHDRLTGKNTSKDTSNITSEVNDDNTSKIKSKDTSNVTDENADKVKSNDTSKNNINDISDITSKVNGGDTSDVTGINNGDVTSNDTSEIIGDDIIKNFSFPEPPLPAKETKKAATFYFDKSVHDRFERYVKDQIKTKKLKSSKVKSYYAEAALDFFLKSQGY